MSCITLRYFSNGLSKVHFISRLGRILSNWLSLINSLSLSVALGFNANSSLAVFSRVRSRIQLKPSSRYTTFKVVQSSCHSRYTNSCLVSVVFKSLRRSRYTTGLRQGGHTLRGQEDSLMSLSGRLGPQRGTDAPATSRLSFPPWPGSRQAVRGTFVLMWKKTTTPYHRYGL